MFWHSILSWLVLCEMVLVCISFCLCLFFLYIIVRFFNVRLEVHPSFESLFRWRGPFLFSVIEVVVDTCIGTVVAVPVVYFVLMSPVRASIKSVGGFCCR